MGDTEEDGIFAGAFTVRALGAAAWAAFTGTSVATDLTALIEIGFTATDGVIGESTTPGTSETDRGNDANGKDVNVLGSDKDGDMNVGTGAEGRIGPVLTVIFFITWAAAGEGATMHTATTMAKTRLTRAL